MEFTNDVKEEESIRRHVPWFSIDEFKEVYTYIFSNDLKDVKRGYDRLLMWKARRPVLPPGIEAMFNLCEVVLQDKKCEESSAEVNIPQLRLMYATTIMRFLNLMLGITPGNKVEKKTLFHQADEVGIPKWIVDIRHDSAHGSVMPDIGVLRSAARFSTNWLKERYWERALHISDLIVEEGEHVVSDHEEVVEKVVECWESFAIYESSGYESKNETEHPELWELVKEIGASLKSKRHRPTEEIVLVADALTILNQKIRELLRNRVNVAVKSIFIRKMLSGDILLPSKKVLQLFKKEPGAELPQQLISMWTSVMKDLWESGSIQELLTQLIYVMRDNNDTRSRRRFALLWIHQILKSLIMVQESKKMQDAISERSADFQLSHVYFDKYPDCSYQEQLCHAVTDAVTSLRPELKSAYSWGSRAFPHFIRSNELLQKCLANPPPTDVQLILPSIMELMDPPLSADMQGCLQECVRIYSGQENSSKVSTQDKLYSLADILGATTTQDAAVADEMGCIETHSDHSNPGFRSLKNIEPDESGSSPRVPWKKSDDVLNWGRCSLGILPWQYENGKTVWKSFEMQTVWKRRKIQS